MTVWLVMKRYPYEGSEVIKVFSSYEVADKYIVDNKLSFTHYTESFEVNGS